MMKAYTLYNKDLKKKLMHPRIGLWYTMSLDEAVGALHDCHDYLEAIGAADQKNQFVVIDAETNEEVTLS